MSGMRPLQRFLSGEGAHTVSTTNPPTTHLECDCPVRKPCAHIRWVEARMVLGFYPLNLSKDVTPEELEEMLAASDEAFGEFISMYGAVEVLEG